MSGGVASLNFALCRLVRSAGVIGFSDMGFLGIGCFISLLENVTLLYNQIIQNKILLLQNIVTLLNSGTTWHWMFLFQ
jgi:hypothetical protein